MAHLGRSLRLLRSWLRILALMKSKVLARQVQTRVKLAIWTAICRLGVALSLATSPAKGPRKRRSRRPSSIRLLRASSSTALRPRSRAELLIGRYLVLDACALGCCSRHQDGISWRPLHRYSCSMIGPCRIGRLVWSALLGRGACHCHRISRRWIVFINGHFVLGAAGADASLPVL